MNDRFEQLYRLSKNLYVEGAPIVILAGSLLKDKVSGSIVAQIKYQSLSKKPIKALKLHIMTMDVSGQELGDIIEYQYLDLNVRAGHDFGSNKAIVIPNIVSRSFRVVDITVIFDDGKQWLNDEKMKPLAIAQSLKNALGEFKMVEQYRMATNRYAVYRPIEDSDLWYCSCGLWNREEHCVRCSLGKTTAFKAYNVDSLRETLNARIAEEEEKARIAKDKAEAEEAEHKRKTKKTMLIVTPIVIVVGIILILLLTRVDRIKNQARDAINEGNYLSAMEILEEIDGEEGVLSLQEEIQRLMSDEISSIIGNNDCEQAISLIDKYSDYLSDIIIDSHMAVIRSICLHENTYTEGRDATCENDGYSNKICNVCGYVKEILIEALGHSFSSEITKEATCTEDGNEHKVCNTCGHEEDVSIKKLGHSYDKKDIVKPTCDKAGEYQYTCKNCGDSYTEAVKATGHSWKDATCTTAKTCNTCGKIEGSALEHNWVESSGSKKCSLCGEKVTIKLDDSLLYGTWKCTSISGNYRIFIYSGTTASNTLYSYDGYVLDRYSGTVSWYDNNWLIITGQREGNEGNDWKFWMEINSLTEDSFLDGDGTYPYYKE